MNNTRHRMRCKRGTFSRLFHKATLEADDTEANRQLKAYPLPDFRFLPLRFHCPLKFNYCREIRAKVLK